MFVEGGKTKTDVFSLDSLITWLEKQPADKRYDYRDCRYCMLGQYFTAMGLQDVSVGEATLFHEGTTGYPLPPGFNAIAQNPGSPWTPKERTFGAALARARAMIS